MAARDAHRNDSLIPTVDLGAPAPAFGRNQKHFQVRGFTVTACEFHECLVFFGPYFARRVRSFPANWSQLSEIELDALSWRR